MRYAKGLRDIEEKQLRFKIYANDRRRFKNIYLGFALLGMFSASLLLFVLIDLIIKAVI
tara:strand:- start:891 stop:1067 length:177 start_codon:yes stop_codon:yes gene_type:complete